MRAETTARSCFSLSLPNDIFLSYHFIKAAKCIIYLFILNIIKYIYILRNK